MKNLFERKRPFIVVKLSDGEENLVQEFHTAHAVETKAGLVCSLVCIVDMKGYVKVAAFNRAESLFLHLAFWLCAFFRGFWGNLDSPQYQVLDLSKDKRG